MTEPTFICPVCGYDRLREPPKDHAICPCCGKQFSYDDARLSHDVLHGKWMDSGCPWRSKRVPMPENWNPAEQVARLVAFDFAAVKNVTPT